MPLQVIEAQKSPRLPSARIAEFGDDLPLSRAYYWEKTHRYRVFLRQPVNGRLRDWNWMGAMNEARRVAAYLEAQHWPPGSHIVILSKNCAWWIMAELAIWMSGHVTVPIYTSLNTESCRRLMDHCEPVACFLGPVDNAALLSESVPENLTCIRFPNAPPCRSLEWDALVRTIEPMEGNPLRAADDVATVIYTSGTTGVPKGAMHGFGAFPHFAKAVRQVTGIKRRHRVLSYLPLAHIAERALTETATLYEGWQIFFCENAGTFVRDLRRARPTVFFSVPRLYAKFQAGVLDKISQRKLNLLLSVPLVGSLVRRLILRELGLGAVRFAASGSAAIPQELLGWFRGLGLRLAEGYGTTEAGITHTAPRGLGRLGTVGRSAPGVQTRISLDGEVQVKSPMNMLGYFKDPAATRENFTQDGFIRTGDLGEVDPAGWLKIKGRIKEQFKTSKGKYVTPSVIEALLDAHSAIDCSLVMGSGLAAPFAVAVLSAEARRLAATQEGRDSLERSLEALLQSVDAKLTSYERLLFLVLTDESWSIETGFLTPTLKLKRLALEAHYEPRIAEWLAIGGKVVWYHLSLQNV